MRKQLGADWKSEAGIVVDRIGLRRPKGNEQVRVAASSRGTLSGVIRRPGETNLVALTVTQWLGPVPRAWFNTRRQPPSADPHARWCGEDLQQ